MKNGRDYYPFNVIFIGTKCSPQRSLGEWRLRLGELEGLGKWSWSFLPWTLCTLAFRRHQSMIAWNAPTAPRYRAMEWCSLWLPAPTRCLAGLAALLLQSHLPTQMSALHRCISAWTTKALMEASLTSWLALRPTKGQTRLPSTTSTPSCSKTRATKGMGGMLQVHTHWG